MQLKTKPKGSVNRTGVIEATDGRRLKYRTIWRENGKQCSKGFETLEEAIDFRRYIENEMINEYKKYLEEENNAENLFKKLGYEKNEINESIYWEQPAIFELGEHTPYVSFDLVNKKWHTNIVNVEKDKSLIQAINKQIEELG